MNKYFLPFSPSAKVDYLFLLSLYDLAIYNSNTNIYNKVYYTSVKALSTLLNISPAKLNRIFSNTDYNLFFDLDKKDKVITIHNDFTEKKQVPFVVLTQKEVNLIKSLNDNLFSKYVIYVKYYCGYCKNQNQDFTAGQFLLACGYSCNSNSYLSKISNYNKILQDNNIISIKKYRDELGHTRNSYLYR